MSLSTMRSAAAEAPSLEMVQFELALQSCDLLAHDFETCVVQALEAVGGRLLFEMRVDTIAEAQRVAAVALGEGEEREISMAFLGYGGAIRIEPLAACPDHLAGFAASCAGVFDRLEGEGPR